jgi:two-component system, sensor histidine kinase and response regulator
MSTIEILIVEDSPTQALTLRFILESAGYSVREAANGRLGLEELTRHRPTMVISDVMMPEMDGYEFCTRIKSDAALRDIPVILLTTLSDPQDIIRGLESGADNFLNKPYTEDSLLARIKYILVNQDVRTGMRTGMGIEIYFANRKHYLTAERIQIIDLLLSTYENAVEKNRELENANRRLRELHEELEQRNEELVRLNGEKNNFLAMAAHDLRNPLNLIEGYAAFLLGDPAAAFQAEHRDILHTIRSNSAHMVRLISEILDVYRIESGNMQLALEDVDVVQLAARVAHAQQPAAARKSMRIVLSDGGGGMPPVMADPGRIEQVLANLVDNAVKFSAPGAEVRIDVTRRNGSVCLAVCDGGPGIPDKEMHRLFTPFGRTSVRATAGEKSTGLGLSIARRIVEQHGGDIWAESEVGTGSTFYFTLPLLAVPLAVSAA